MPPARLPRRTRPTLAMPQPLETDDVRAVAVGTAGWLAALVVLLPFAGSLSASGRGTWPWICLVGVLLGLVGVWWCRRRQAALRRAAAGHGSAAVDRAGQEQAAPLQEPLT